MAWPTTTITPGAGTTIFTLPGSNVWTDPLAVATAGAVNWPTTQVSVASTDTLLVAARTGRFGVVITNTGTTAVYLGISGVTTSTGAFLPGVVGASKTIPFTGAIHGIVVSGTQTVTVEEYY